MTMTKLNNYFLKLLAIGSIVFLYSCGEDDPVEVLAPSISITSSDFDDANSYTGEAGDMISATIDISADGGFNTLRITKSGGEPFDEIVETKTSGEDGPPTFEATFEYTLVEAEEGETVTFTIQVADDTDAGTTSTETLTVITEEPASPDARVYTTVLLSAPLGLPSSAKTFFSTSAGTTYSPSDVTDSSDPISASIDFGYYEGSSSGANLASPLSFDTNSNAGISAQTDSWGSLNDITFRTTTLTSAEFLEVVTFADIDAAYEAGTAPTDPANVSSLAVDDVIAFATDADKTGGSKKGLIQVIGITPGTGTSGQIELEVVVQEEAN